MIYTPEEFEHLLTKFLDPSWEPGYDSYKGHFENLKAIIVNCKAPLEGSLFTLDQPTSMPEHPVDEFRVKRRNFALFSTGGLSMLEIGFNSGFSCLLALTVNKDLTYTGIDIGHHAYARPCYEYLQSVFGNRVRLHFGDSREVVPVLRTRGFEYDLFHIDGGHGVGTAQADLCNVLNFKAQEATLLVDDTGNQYIDAMCDFYVMQGRLSRVEFKRLWSDTVDQRLFRAHPVR